MIQSLISSFLCLLLSSFTHFSSRLFNARFFLLVFGLPICVWASLRDTSCSITASASEMKCNVDGALRSCEIHETGGGQAESCKVTAPPGQQSCFTTQCDLNQETCTFLSSKCSIGLVPTSSLCVSTYDQSGLVDEGSCSIDYDKTPVVRSCTTASPLFGTTTCTIEPDRCFFVLEETLRSCKVGDSDCNFTTVSCSLPSGETCTIPNNTYCKIVRIFFSGLSC